MDTKIRVLAIAPYEGMKNLMLSLVEDYPEIELKACIGDLQEGLDLAKRLFPGNYDVVISRGGTAALIRKTGLPVIDVEISSFDILCALKLANGMTEKTAIVSYADIASTARQIKDLLGYDTDIFPADSPEGIREAIRKAKNTGCKALLCDMIADTVARAEGLNSYLITSGEKSIRRAFRQAVMLRNNNLNLHNRSRLLNELVFSSPSYSFVFEADGTLVLSTNTNPSEELMEFFRADIRESKGGKEVRKIFKSFDGLMYMIKAEPLFFEKTVLYTYICNIGKVPVAEGKSGLYYSTRKDAEEKFNQSVFSYSGLISIFNDDIGRLNRTDTPVMIVGEDGTGKETVANLLYMKSRHKNGPLVTIDCRLLDDKSLAMLVGDESTPLGGRKSTIYFSNIEAISRVQGHRLLSAILEMEVCSRNRVIFSCSYIPGEGLSDIGQNFTDRLCCTQIKIPPLREIGNFGALVTQFLSHKGIDSANPIVGMEPNGIQLLREFNWPHNLTQFKRVMTELEIACNGSVITEESVRSTLEKEQFTGSVNPGLEESATPIDLSRTLDEINRDVIQRVLEANNGSHTATAKQLGIGRTTLWRYLKG